MKQDNKDKQNTKPDDLQGRDTDAESYKGFRIDEHGQIHRNKRIN